MGEVYRARDTTLNRDVAIKVLPEHFALDAERLARFTREAQSLAALNHPHIAQVYGLQGDTSSGSARALVMELVEGNDLSALIARGPMPVDDILSIARQIADALETAHEQGIIHRDLKPANVKVRPDGTVKVLDFGLAKAMDPAGVSSADAMASPTLTARATQMGTIIGTAAYMAPEQAKGKAVDKRADIWAFGVVLYEMLTGRRAFDGDDVSTTLAAVLMKDPEWTALPDNTPAALRALVSRCLVKNPRQRLRDMGEARLQLEDALEGRAGSPPAIPGVAGTGAPKHTRRAWQVATAMAVVAGAAAAAAWLVKPSTPTPLLRLSIALPAGDQVTSPPAISSDGHLVAYAAGHTAATSQLYLRALDDFTARSVEGSAGAEYPFFSPDGRMVAFFAGGKLRRASTAGGAATDIASAPTPWGGTWDSEGRIVFTTGLGSGLWSVAADGGRPEQLTKPDGAAAGYAHVFPQRLPGTHDLLFAFWGQTFYTARLSVESRTWREVTSPVRAFASVHLYTASGHLLTHDGASGIMAARWQPETVAPVTAQTPVLEDVNWALGTERSWLDVSDNGTAVYVPGDPRDRHVVWVDRQGRISRLTGQTQLVNQATQSHDGRRIVYGSMREQWVLDLASGTRTRVVADVRSWHGGWLPGDDRLVISSNKDGDWDLYTVSAAGGELQPLLKRPFAQHVQAVTPDGAIVYLERQPASGSDLWMLTPDGRTTPLVVTPFNESSASISSDGRFIAYVSDESGRNDVYAVPASGKGNRTMVSIDGGTGPVWSRDGRELFYRTGDDLLSVQVRTTEALELGERRKLMDLSGYDSGYFHEFDVSPDGQRFLLIRTEPQSRPTRLDIVLNWTDELKRVVPTR
jgi:Tol biopolymer transport system component